MLAGEPEHLETRGWQLFHKKVSQNPQKAIAVRNQHYKLIQNQWMRLRHPDRRTPAGEMGVL